METVKIIKMVELTTEEKEERAIELADKLTSVEELEEELKEFRKDINDKIDILDVRIEDLVGIIKSGQEERTFECIKEKDFEGERNIFYQVVDGEETDIVIKESPFGPQDYQRDLELSGDYDDEKAQQGEIDEKAGKIIQMHSQGDPEGEVLPEQRRHNWNIDPEVKIRKKDGAFYKSVICTNCGATGKELTSNDESDDLPGPIEIDYNFRNYPEFCKVD